MSVFQMYIFSFWSVEVQVWPCVYLTVCNFTLQQNLLDLFQLVSIYTETPQRALMQTDLRHTWRYRTDSPDSLLMHSYKLKKLKIVNGVARGSLCDGLVPAKNLLWLVEFYQMPVISQSSQHLRCFSGTLVESSSCPGMQTQANAVLLLCVRSL